MKQRLVMPVIFSLFVFALVCSFSQPIGASLDCDQWLMQALPTQNSEVFQKLVKQIREDFARTRTFSIINFQEFIPPGFIQEIAKGMNENDANLIQVGTVNFLDIEPVYYNHYANHRKRTSSLPSKPTIQPSHRKAIEAIVHWFDLLLRSAFPQFPAYYSDSAAQIRFNNGQADQAHTMDNVEWHPDGGLFGIIIALDGAGPYLSSQRKWKYPEVPAETSIAKVLQGQAAIFFGSDIEKVDASFFKTPHKTPDYKGRRMIFLHHFHMEKSK